jgi:hypothetical protein
MIKKIDANNINNRFEIGIEETKDNLEHVPNIHAAFLSASAIALRNSKATVYVFDTMAHPGQVQLWHYVRKENALRVQKRKASNLVEV